MLPSANRATTAGIGAVPNPNHVHSSWLVDVGSWLPNEFIQTLYHPPHL
jgi:hypothetical protein